MVFFGYHWWQIPEYRFTATVDGLSGLSIPEKRAGNIRHVKQDGGYPSGWENGFYGEIRFSRISFWHGQPDSCIATGKTFLPAFPARRPPGKCMQVLPAVSVNSHRPFLVYFEGWVHNASRPEPVFYCGLERVRSFFPMAGDLLLFFYSCVVGHDIAASPDDEGDKYKEPGVFVVVVWHDDSPECRVPFRVLRKKFTARVQAARWPGSRRLPRSLPRSVP